MIGEYEGKGDGVSRTAVGNYNQNVDGVLYEPSCPAERSEMNSVDHREPLKVSSKGLTK